MQQSGFITIEFLVALAVVVTIVSATSQLAASMNDAQLDWALVNEAAGIVHADLESLATTTVHMYALPPLPIVPNPFALTRILTAASSCTAVISDQVTWKTSRERILSRATSFTDLQHVQELGNDCPPSGLSDTWHNSQVLVSTLCHARVSMHSADVLNRNGKRIAFVGGTSSQAADPDICIYDVTLADTPKLLSSINTGAGIFALDGAGDYVYAVQNVSSLQFQVVDVTDPTHPFVVASRSLPGVSGSFPQGRSIFVFRNRAYVGTYETAGAEFHVFDITDPRNPRALGNRAVNHSLRQILVRGVLVGGVEHILAFVDSSADAAEVVILDATNPTAITELSHIDLPGAGSGTAETFLGTNLIIARQQGSGEKALARVDITNPASPQIVELADIFLKAGSVVNGLLASNTTLVLTTTDTTATTLICPLSLQGHFGVCTRSKNIGNPGRPDYQDDLVFAADGHGLTILKAAQ